MADDSSFDQTWERDSGGTVRVKTTCKRCGATSLVNVRDGSLEKWRRDHVCSDLPKKPPKGLYETVKLPGRFASGDDRAAARERVRIGTTTHRI